jgi:hypothetical protein
MAAQRHLDLRADARLDRRCTSGSKIVPKATFSILASSSACRTGVVSL